ncbi:C40 family peptidase [Nonomuraea sp. SMC257]|uniref:C40 family peptidase n=1 Tax=Nonomuraea montanisoli TaxID=2741721 RepID=A0A7Y6M538_9ACTN|nr:NlpC/P60 family protein [Nonomuraea montanisoli]NUW35418.1 C40 family peptidase [Nonomuraea montanisoli]
MSPRPVLTPSLLCRASVAIGGSLFAGLTALPGPASATPTTAPCFGTVTLSKTYARLLTDRHLTDPDALSSSRPRHLKGTARPILFAARPGSLAQGEVRLVVTLPPQACEGSPPLTAALDRAGITITHPTPTPPTFPTWWPLWPYRATPSGWRPQPLWRSFQNEAPDNPNPPQHPELPTPQPPALPIPPTYGQPLPDLHPTQELPSTGLPSTTTSQKPRRHAPTPPRPADTHDQETNRDQGAKSEYGGYSEHSDKRDRADKTDRADTRTSGEIAVAAALDQLGTPFSWGGGASTGPTRGVGRGAGTTGFDCSGLTLYAWSKAGVKLGHYTGSQFRQGHRVPVTALRKGDLVFFGGGTGDPTHVGLYLGDGIMIHAPKTGDVVRKTSFLDSSHYRPRYRGAVRPG